MVSSEPCLVETYLGKAGKDGGQEWKSLYLEVLDTNTWMVLLRPAGADVSLLP